MMPVTDWPICPGRATSGSCLSPCHRAILVFASSLARTSFAKAMKLPFKARRPPAFKEKVARVFFTNPCLPFSMTIMDPMATSTQGGDEAVAAVNVAKQHAH